MGKILRYEKQYGRLTIISEPFRKYAKETSSQESTYVKAICECGNIGEYVVRDLKNGTTSSCGCLRGELSGARKRTHGFTKGGIDFDIYRVWQGMKKRCYDKNQPCYKDYGGRGIRVCDEWLNDPVAFHRWALENGYKPGLFFDKADNNKDYSPSNCRFITKRESTRNRRFVKLSMEKAKTIRELHFKNNMMFVDIAKIYNVNPNTIGDVVKNKIWVSE